VGHTPVGSSPSAAAAAVDYADRRTDGRIAARACTRERLRRVYRVYIHDAIVARRRGRTGGGGSSIFVT